MHCSSFFLMTPTKPHGIGLPVHGTHAYPQSVLRPFLGVLRQPRELDRERGRPARVPRPRVRAHERPLARAMVAVWRTARFSSAPHASRSAVFLPSELAAHATRLVPAFGFRFSVLPWRVRAMTREKTHAQVPCSPKSSPKKLSLVALGVKKKTKKIALAPPQK